MSPSITDTWRGIVTASASGELLYQHGAFSGGSRLVWYDATGKQGEPVLPETADYYNPGLSPDASKLAFALENNGIADIWVVDLARHTRTRLTFGPQYSALLFFCCFLRSHIRWGFARPCQNGE